jgi:DNA modification methylase
MGPTNNRGTRMIELINDDCRNHVSRIAEHDNCLVIYDPPYDEWDQVINVEATSKIAFTSPQRRHETENILGKPRNEIVWFFKDGRWVSKNLPRITHNYIFIYGKTSDAAVGPDQEIKTMKKGYTSIGKDNLGPRIFTTKPRKHLNSVLEYPRNMKSGSWGKPIGLLKNVIEWIDPDIVFDLYMGTGSAGKACLELNKSYVGIEKNSDVFEKTKAHFSPENRQ